MTHGAQHAQLTGADPTLIAINPWRLVLHACLVAIVGLGLLMSGAFFVWVTGSVAFPIWPALALGVLFCAWAVLNIGIAWSRPCAVRIDTFGLSGFYAPALEWSEISSVEVDPKGLRLLIGVKDMHAVRMSQPNVWRRFRFMGRAFVVHGRGLDGDLDQIASIMNAHLSR